MKRTVQLGALSAANIGLSFLFQWYVLTQLGSGLETDALFAGMTLPQLVLMVISASLMHVLVPLLSGEEKGRLRHDAWAFLVLVGGAFALLGGVLYASAGWWIPLIVPGFSDVGHQLTIELTRIQLVGMVFAAINGVQWAAYRAQDRFVWAEVAPVISNVGALALLVWALPIYGVVAAAWISTGRLALQTALLSPGPGRPVWPDLRSPQVAAAWRRVRPLLLGSAYYKTDALVDRYLLSSASRGSLSLYYLGRQVYVAASQVMNRAIAAPLVPKLSNFHKAGDRVSFKREYLRRLRQVGGICAVALIGISVLGQAGLELLVGHGNITTDNVNELWWIMMCLSGVFAGGAMGQVAASSFYASGNTTTPVRIGVYSYTVHLPLRLMAFHFYGVTGLALVQSLYCGVNLFLQDRHLRKNYFRGSDLGVAH